MPTFAIGEKVIVTEPHNALYTATGLVVSKPFAVSVNGGDVVWVDVDWVEFTRPVVPKTKRFNAIFFVNDLDTLKSEQGK